MQIESVIQLIFSAVVTVATVVYAILTWRLVKETIRMRMIQTEPEVMVTAQLSELSFAWINLVIENIGSGPARNVRLTATPDFRYTAQKFLSESGPFKNGLTYLAPRQQIRILVFPENGWPATTEVPLEITVVYETAQGQRTKRLYSLDISGLADTKPFSVYTLKDLARQLENIERQLRDLPSRLNGMKVVAYTRHEESDEQNEASEIIETREATQSHNPASIDV
jgi:hypothetical protein